MRLRVSIAGLYMVGSVFGGALDADALTIKANRVVWNVKAPDS